MQQTLWSISALSLELGIDRRTLAKKLSDVPADEITKSGKRDYKKWKLANVINHLFCHTDDDYDGISFEEAKRRKIAAEAELAEIQLFKEKGEAISIEVANQLWEKAVTSCRAKLLSIPTEVSPFLATESDEASIQLYIEKSIHEALNELADGTIQYSSDSPSESRMVPESKSKKTKATTKAKSQ